MAGKIRAEKGVARQLNRERAAGTDRAKAGRAAVAEREISEPLERINRGIDEIAAQTDRVLARMQQQSR